MSFSKFFAQQARKPSGLFGRFIMSRIFDKGNVFLNQCVIEIIAVNENDHILEIGFGTGLLISEMARQINEGLIEGIEFSDEMISIAEKRNEKYISDGKVKILKGNFDEVAFEKNTYDKICTINTIYFWKEPKKTAEKIARILKPGGKFITAFEDNKQLQDRNLDEDIFQLYSAFDVKDLLFNAGFLTDVSVESRKKGKSKYHCVVGIK
jgi:ubiquinone/menaquinone biosynthesis C-methylase UbiE